MPWMTENPSAFEVWGHLVWVFLIPASLLFCEVMTEGNTPWWMWALATFFIIANLRCFLFYRERQRCRNSKKPR